jgi:hypothetical protein
MKPLFLGLALLTLSSTAARADEPAPPAHDFPHAGSLYYLVYANATRSSDRVVAAQDGLTLRILKVLPNGWVYAARQEVSREANRNTYKDSTPSWFNLQAFANATEIKTE